MNSITTPSINPCYVIEETLLRRNLQLIQSIAEQAEVEFILAFKSFALWRTFPIFREYIHSSTASSIWEAQLGYDEMRAPVHTFTPAYTNENFATFMRYSSHITFNSLEQWQRFGPQHLDQGVSFGIRINPEYSPVETDLYNPAMPGSRFGVPANQLPEELPHGLDGLHLHALCEGTAEQLESLLNIVEKNFAKQLKQVKWLNLGGGHLVTHEAYNVSHLIKILKAFKQRHPHLKVILEPGSAFAWQTGYLTSQVVDIVERNDIKTAILNVSFTCHMPDCLEMPYQPVVRGAASTKDEKPYAYRLGGNSCLSGDYIGWWSFDQPLKIGDEVIFEDMIHYTTVKTNMFNGIEHPSIAMRHTDGSIELLRSYDYDDYKQRMD